MIGTNVGRISVGSSRLNNIQYILPINTCYYIIYPFIALSQSAQRCFRVNVVTQFHHDTERHAKENPSEKKTQRSKFERKLPLEAKFIIIVC